MRCLFILNDPPYGTERSYNGLRLARELLKDPGRSAEVKMFLIGDAAGCARAGQKVPQGYYSVESMLQGIAVRGSAIGVCGSCMDARGLADNDLVRGCARSTMAELADWTDWADKTLVF